jgi:hypothetical protein
MDIEKSLAYSIQDHDAFRKACDKFDEDMTFDVYVAYIYRYLTEVAWGYDSEYVLQLIDSEFDFIKQDFEQKQSPASCAVNTGYGCG